MYRFRSLELLTTLCLKKKRELECKQNETINEIRHVLFFLPVGKTHVFRGLTICNSTMETCVIGMHYIERERNV